MDCSDNPHNETLEKPPRVSQFLSSQSSMFSGVDSGYCSLVNSPDNDDSRAGVPISPAWLSQRKAKNLKVFDKEIPYLTQVRYADIHELLLETCFYHYLTEANLSCSGISIKLRVLGESEETAKPWILVLCPKKASRRVKQFFKQKHVKSEYQPCATDLSRPSFEILVHELPPTLLPRLLALTRNPSEFQGDYDDSTTLDVYGNVKDINKYTPTLCGAAIRVSAPNAFVHSGTATLGGVIKVRTSKNFELYGMTAGHIFTGEQQLGLHSSEDLLCVSIGTVGLDEVTNDSDGHEVKPIAEADEGEYSSEEDDYVLDWNGEEEQCTTQIGSISGVSKSSAQPDVGWCMLGHVDAVSHDSRDYRGNLDWALVTIDDPSFYRPNLLLYQNADNGVFEMKNLSGPPQTSTDHSPSQSVILLSGTNGPREGTLSRVPAFILLAPGKNFKKTYTLTFDDKSGKIYSVFFHFVSNKC
jgi:hypothetical protein